MKNIILSWCISIPILFALDKSLPNNWWADFGIGFAIGLGALIFVSVLRSK